MPKDQNLGVPKNRCPEGSLSLVFYVGCHRWAHFLFHLLPPACGLGPVTPGKLQEAGVKGAGPSSCD